MPKLPCPNASANEMEIERQTNGAATPPRAMEVGYADLRHPGTWSGSELLARILDGVADGIAAHDASGHLIFINDAGARMCGYDSATVALSAPSGDFFQRVQVYDALGNAIAESELPGPLAARGRAVPDRILCIQLRGCGSERWVSVKATPILDRRGAVRMSISIFRDVTRERQAEAERDRVVRELESERRRLTGLVEQLRATATRPGLGDR
jgi:PAS domain-containing protein